MTIAQINSVCGSGSTGKICVSLSQLLDQKGYNNTVYYSSGNSNHVNGVKYTSDLYIKTQALRSRILGNYGFNSASITKDLIRRLKEQNADIVHLHNLHGHNCDLSTLFSYLKENHIKVIWTFHDCWAFTAYCPHFTFVGCDKWKTECCDCHQYRAYSWLKDRSRYLYNKKKELFSGLDMTIVTPSVWLADLVKQSFLKDYPVKVINNGIDLSVFKPTDSDFRTRCGIPQSKNVILGVAFGWGKRKGLDVFVDLAKRLDGENYQIVLVGTDSAVDKQLPDNIISIHRTQNQTELAEIYTAADLFVNPTREENYPTVNMESIACGTPVLTFRTGGSPEIVDETCGCVVDCDDVDAMEREITRICTERAYSKDDCILRARAFDKDERFKEYVELYESLVHI